ncbi:hypothetical protein [Nostoc sp. DedQUE09]|uniref:hypothetical protein n=1 Tax=Nostoc sp. DedQUE09 TaxID=3075394 RepID=UPI002AD1F3C0|nr:hypothetical protein [Nostoc sp. DedQUE09]MDZ7950516.1 hypothetical protein [Nostoc sp. DedQUE09]
MAIASIGRLRHHDLAKTDYRRWQFANSQKASGSVGAQIDISNSRLKLGIIAVRLQS